MPTPKQHIGSSGEDLAVNFLTRKGHTLLARNVHSEHGEIDIITRHGARLCFVEVKTRTSTAFGLPEASITRKKQATMIACAEAYLSELAHPDLDWQIDVIAIQLFNDRSPIITHFENAVTE